MKLCDCEQKWLATALFNLYALPRPWRVGGANLISIEPMTVTYRARQLSSVTKMNSNDPVRLAGGDPGGNSVTDGATLVSNLHRVDVNVAAFFPNRFCKPQLLCRVRTNQRGIVPCYLRQRLWQFLQPAVVGKTPVIDCGIG